MLGNPTLQPESSASFSAGASYQRGQRVRRILFRHNLNNLIDSYSVGMPQTQAEMAALLEPYGVPVSFDALLNRLTFIYLNLNRARTEGFELSSNVAVTSQVHVQSAYASFRGRPRHRPAAAAAPPAPGLRQSRIQQSAVGHADQHPRGVLFSKWPLNPAAGTYGYGSRIWELQRVEACEACNSGSSVQIDNLAPSRESGLDSGTPSFESRLNRLHSCRLCAPEIRRRQLRGKCD